MDAHGRMTGTVKRNETINNKIKDCQNIMIVLYNAFRKIDVKPFENYNIKRSKIIPTLAIIHVSM